MESEESLDIKNVILTEVTHNRSRKSFTQSKRFRDESPASRERRLRKQKEIDKQRRGNESPASRERRLQRQREYNRRYLSVKDDKDVTRHITTDSESQSTEEVKSRGSTQKNEKKRFRHESPASRERRLRRQNETDNQRRRNESPASRERRLQKQRDYDRRRRAIKDGITGTSADANALGLSWVPSEKSLVEYVKPNLKERVYHDSNFCRFCLQPIPNSKGKSIPKPFLELYEKHFDIEFERNEAYPNKICTSCQYKAHDIIKFLDNIKESQPKMKEILITIELEHNNHRDQLLEVEIESATVPMQNDPFDNTNEMLPTFKTEPQDDDEFTAYDHIEDYDMMPEENEDFKGNFPLFNPLVEVEIPIKTEKQNVQAFTAGPSRIIKKRLRTTKFKSANPRRYRRGIRSCDLCGFEYNTHGGIKRHIEDEHIKKNLPPHQPFKCPECELSFSSKYLRLNHKSLVHFDKSHFLCKECNIQFLNNHQIYQHRRLKHSPKVICTFCAEFVSEGIMGKHIRAKHTPCECEYCGEKFDGQCPMNNHIQKEHGNGPQACPYCQSIFMKIKLLRAHIKDVHNEIQLRCLVEGCTFATPSRGYMKNHLLSHKDIDVSLRERLLVEIDLFRAAREQMMKLAGGH